MPLSETQKIEKKVAKEFLDLYNTHMGTSFEITILGDTPDVSCIDYRTGEKLHIEITLLEDLPGDIKYLLGKGQKPISPTTRSRAISFFDDSAEKLKSSLKDKLLSKYGKDTALVLKQVNIAWEKKDWQMVADDVRIILLDGKEENYGAGIWIICTNNSPWPATNDLFCLSRPGNNCKAT